MQPYASPEHVSNNTDSEESISLVDVVQLFKEGKRWILGTAICCTVIGTTYAFFASPKYEAFASIEMAQVTGTPVETSIVLTEKLKLPLYYSPATLAACKVENKQPSPGEFLANQLKPSSNKNAPILSIKFRAESPTIARQCLEAVLADVKKNQGILSKPILDIKKSQLSLLQSKLEAAEKLSAQLPVGNVKFQFDDPKFSASALLLATSISKENEIKDLRTQINDIQIMMAEPQTKETSLITSIYAPQTKIEPKKPLIILSSAIGGMLLGLLFWIGRKTIRSAQLA